MKNAVEAMMEVGNQHSINTLEQFTGAKVEFNVKMMNLFNSKDEEQLRNLKQEKDVMILVTEIIGDVEGRTYFMCTREEWDYISGIGIRGSMTDSAQFRGAFMMELDNIISAAFVSKIADAFSLKIYGAAPVLISDNNEYVCEELNKKPEHYLTVTTIGLTENIRPVFICSLANPYSKKAEEASTSKSDVGVSIL